MLKNLKIHCTEKRMEILFTLLLKTFFHLFDYFKQKLKYLYEKLKSIDSNLAFSMFALHAAAVDT